MKLVSSNGRRNLRRSLLLSSALTGVMLVGAGSARADDLTITTQVTDPVQTSIAANASPGNVTITAAGSIVLDAGDVNPAITIDSTTASIQNLGTITAAFADQNGILVSVGTTGGIENFGTLKTGTTQVVDGTGAITTTGVGADPAILVQADLGEGINNTGSISSIASTTNPNAILVQATGSAVTVGVIDNTDTNLDYSIRNTGSIFSIGYLNGTPAVAIGLEGASLANSVTLSGIHNQGGTIQATSAEDSATAIEVGAFSTLSNGTTAGIVNDAGSTILASIVSDTFAGASRGIHVLADGTIDAIENSGTIRGASSGDVGGSAFAIDIDPLGSLTTITNNSGGLISALALSDGSIGTAIRDQAGSLTDIVNDGIISATATATGQAVALNLLSAAANTTITNTGTISGEILLGGGTYQIDSSDGLILSAISVDIGTATINLTGDAILTASSSLTNAATLNVTAATGTTINAAADNLNVSDIVFNSGSTFATSYDTATSTASGYIVADNATLHDGTTVNVTLTSYLGTATPTLTLVETSSSLNFDTPADTSGLVIGGIGAGYNAVLNLINGDSDLTITLSRKTATQLGLSGNAAIIYDASVDALEADTSFGAAVGNLATVGDVVDLYDQLLPDLSGARETIAIRMQDISAGFVNDRLGILRTKDQGAGYGGGKYYDRYRRAGLWAQQSVSSEKGDGGLGTQSMDGTLYALAVGYDKRGKEGDVWGGSLTYAAMSYDAGQNMKDNLAQSTMLQAYYAMNRGPFFWDTVGSLAYNTYETKRVVTAGAVSRTAEGDWAGYQGGLSSQLGYGVLLGPISIRPSVGASYTFLSQEAYSENGGGAGVDLSIDSSTYQSLRANAELRISGIFSKSPQFVPFVRGGISHELLDEDIETSGKFLSTGSSFTLQGESLDTDVPYVGAGLSVVGGYSRLTVEYTGQLGSKFTSHQGVATFSLMF